MDLLVTIGWFSTLAVHMIFLNVVLSPFLEEKLRSKNNVLLKLLYLLLGFLWLVSFIWVIAQIPSFLTSGCPIEYKEAGIC